MMGDFGKWAKRVTSQPGEDDSPTVIGASPHDPPVQTVTAGETPPRDGECLASDDSIQVRVLSANNKREAAVRVLDIALNTLRSYRHDVAVQRIHDMRVELSPLGVRQAEDETDGRATVPLSEASGSADRSAAPKAPVSGAPVSDREDNDEDGSTW